MTAYYNEIDKNAAAWLRELIRRGLIAPGEVDERSIEDVRPDELRGFTQCHFFAGIGVWSYALRQAGWPDDRPVWTGSCPCQPFSSAGQRKGLADERHLWPAFFHLIEQCRPPVVLGEQVASKDGLAWLDLVQADLEGTNHAFGAVDLCAAGFGAPHIRQRLWWVAKRLGDADDERLEGHSRHDSPARRAGPGGSAAPAGVLSGLAHAHRSGRGAGQRHDPPARHRDSAPATSGDGRLADAGGERRQQVAAGNGEDCRPGPTNGFWRDSDWLFCRDGKWRPVRSGSFPLAHGTPARVGRLRGYGNAIFAPAAQAFIEAYLETQADRHLLVSEVSEMANDIGIFA